MTPKSVYNLKWKAIKTFVDFNFDGRKDLSKLHSSQKRKINRYFKILQELQSSPTILLKPGRKSRRKIAQKSLGLERYPGLKVFPIPDSGQPDGKVKMDKNGNIKIERKFHEKTFIEFDKKRFARNPAKEVNRILQENPQFKTFGIQFGLKESTVQFSRESILEQILKLIDEYKNNKAWLQGLIGYSFKRQSSQDKYIRELLKNASAKRKLQARKKREIKKAERK